MNLAVPHLTASVMSVTLLALSAVGCTSEPPKDAVGGTSQRKSIVIVTPMSHPSLSLTIQGIQDGLASKGFVGSSLDTTITNANGDFTKVAALTRDAVARKPALIVVLTTPAASEAIRVTDPAGVPLVYAAVTDPVAAKIVTSMSSSTTLATGVSDRYPVKEQVSLFRQLHPTMKSAAILFNPDEQNSRILVDETDRALSEAGVKLIRRQVHNSADIPAQAKLGASEADAVIVNGDNLVIENLEAVINACVTYKKPLLVGDPDSVKKGAVATVGPSYRDIGLKAGLQAARVLSGEDVRRIPSEYPSSFEWVINVQAAKRMAFPIPASVWEARPIWISEDVRR